jgi:hypothetical protein
VIGIKLANLIPHGFPPALPAEAREVACCSFFEFRITAGEQQVVPEVSVPQPRRAVLGALASWAARPQDTPNPADHTNPREF